MDLSYEYGKDIDDILSIFNLTQKYYFLLRVKYIKNSVFDDEYIISASNKDENDGIKSIISCQTDIGTFTNDKMIIIRCYLSRILHKLRVSNIIYDVVNCDSDIPKYLLLLTNDIKHYSKMKLKYA